MTTEALAKLTPEEKRIRIAAACPSVFLCGYPLHGHVQIYLKSTGEAVDPLSDLNAMNEAEKVLTPKQVPLYIDALWNILGNTTAPMRNFSNEQVGHFMWRVHTATAAQRADALLLALG